MTQELIMTFDQVVVILIITAAAVLCIFALRKRLKGGGGCGCKPGGECPSADVCKSPLSDLGEPSEADSDAAAADASADDQPST